MFEHFDISCKKCGSDKVGVEYSHKPRGDEIKTWFYCRKCESKERVL